MKKIILGLLIIFLVMTFACQSQKNVTPEIQNESVLQEKDLLPMGNHSFLKEENVGQSFVITGLLSFSESGNWILTENPKSKSKVSFILEVSEELQKDFEQRKDNPVTVCGILTKVNGTWLKELKVESFQ